MENIQASIHTASGSKIWLRRYKTEDLNEIAKLFYETVHTVNARDYTDEQLNAWAGNDFDYSGWDRTLQEHFSVVAMEGDRIAGFGDMDDTGYLDRLYVHRDCQGIGAGGVLLGLLEAYARSQGNNRVTSHVSRTAKPFFEQRGYQVIKAQQVERKGILLENFVMQKEIGEETDQLALYWENKE